MPKGVPLQLDGRRFGRLVVIGKAAPYLRPNGVRGPSRWLCKCDCGAETTVVGNSLVGGDTRSCGCRATDQLAQRSTTHGHCRNRSRSAEYRSWLSMLNRCRNRNLDCYPDYGGRGITVCERWASSFESFLADMGPRPSAEYSLDRINNDKGYEPSNCRWATRREQGCNKRNNHVVEYGDQMVALSEYCRRTGAPYARTIWRLKHSKSLEGR